MPRDLTLEKRIQNDPVLFKKFCMLKDKLLEAVDDPEMLPVAYRTDIGEGSKLSKSSLIIVLAELFAYVAIANEIILDEAASEMMVPGGSEPEV